MTAATDRSDSAARSAPASEWVREVIDGWEIDQPFHAREVLARRPELAADRSTLLSLALEEYFRLQEQGADVSADHFAGQFPEIRSLLGWHLSIHSRLCADPAELARYLAIDWPVSGDKVEGWRIGEELGRGGFSRVYEVRDTRVGDRPIVVKFTNSPRDEAACVGRLDHPGIVRVLSVQEAAGLTAIAMPFLGRATLLDVIDMAFADGKGTRGEAVRAFQRAAEISQAAVAEAAFSSLTASLAFTDRYVDNVIRVGQRLCDALDYAHGRGTLHCDIKPSNVLIAATGAPILLDFNLAMSASLDSLAIGGTLLYMSPEQLHAASSGDRGGIDVRSDIYSLGGTLYQLLTGALPFGEPRVVGDHRQAVQELRDAQRAGLRPVVERNPDVPAELAAVVESCLALDPAGRPASMRELGERLRACLPRDNAAETVREGGRRRWSRRWLMGGGLAAVVTAVMFALSLSPWDQALAAYDAGDFEVALKRFQALPDQTSGMVQAFEADCCSRLNRWSDAEGLYRQALKAGFDNAPVRNNLGCCCLMNRNLIDGMEFLESANVAENSDAIVEANLAFGDATLASRDLRSPRLIFIQSALTKAPDNPLILATAARVHAVQAARAQIQKSDDEPVLRAQTIDFTRRAIGVGVARSLIDEITVRIPYAEAELEALRSAAPQQEQASPFRVGLLPLPRS